MIKNIGRYQIQGEIGKGGFGKVYRAWDPTVNRQVAIKILTVQGDDDLLTRFRNEAAAAGNLHHKNIVTVHDFGEHNGTPYMVMQLLEGENLQDIISRGRPLTLLDKLNIMQEVAEGLHCAHQHGIVHRDVKPANIMILPDESVQIMDFGIARVTASASRQTRTGFVIGTVLYMAPEQFLPNMEVDYRADIWAYGVIYYELLTGRHPFAAPEQTAILYQIAHVDPAPVNTVAPDCPPALAEVVQRALMKDREFRYQSLKELQFDVQPILLDLKRDRAAELMSSARELVDSGQVDQANSAIQRILELDPSNRDAHALLSNVKQQLHRRNVQPRIDGFVKRAEEYVSARNYRQAVESIEAALRLSQTDSALRARLEQIRKLQEQALKAERLTNEARQQFEAQNLTGAFRSATEALDADPENARANQIISMVQTEIERRDARRRLDEGLNRAKTLVLLQTFDEAIALLSDLAAKHPEERAIIDLLGSARSEKEQQERRQRRWREVTSARDAVRERNFESAISRLESLQSDFPGDPEIGQLLVYAREELATHRRGEAIERAGREAQQYLEHADFDSGLRVVEQALSAYSGDPTLLRLMQSITVAKAAHLRRVAVDDCLRSVELLRREGRIEDALRRVNATMLESTEEPRLTELRSLLQREYDAYRRAETLRRDLESAQRYLAEGNHDQAIALAERLRPQYPDEPRIAEILSKAHQAKEQHERQAYLQRQLQKISGLEQAQDWHGALNAAREGLARQPNASALKDAVSRLQQRIADQDRAARIASQAAAIRDVVSARNFAKAEELLRAARKEFSGESIFIALTEQAVAAKRASEVDSAMGKIREAWRSGQLSSCRAQLATALATYPTEQRLVALEQEIASHIYSEAIRVAQEELKKGHFDAAHGSALRALEWRPQDPTATSLLNAVARERQLDAALDHIRAALDSGSFDECRDLIASAAKTYPRESRIAALEDELRNRACGSAVAAARTHLDRGEHDQAEAAARRALLFRGDNQDAASILAKVETERQIATVLARVEQARRDGDAARSRELIAVALKKFPTEPRLTSLAEQIQTDAFSQALNAARRDLEAGRVAEAESACNRALQLRPGDPAAAALLGSVQTEKDVAEVLASARQSWRTGDFERCRDTLRAGIERHPREERLRSLDAEFRAKVAADLVSAARNHLGQQRFDAARQSAVSALAYKPGDKEISALIQTIESEQKIEDAVARTVSARRAGQFDQCLEVLKSALAAHPSAERLLTLDREIRDQVYTESLALAREQLSRQRFDQAIGAAETALTIRPKDPAAIGLIDSIRTEKEIEAAIERAQVARRSGQIGKALEIVTSVPRSAASEARLKQIAEEISQEIAREKEIQQREQARRRAEEDARKRAEEERRRQVEEDARRQEEEAKARKRAAEEEAKRRADEEKARRKIEEERARKQAEEEQARRKAEQEAQRRAAEEARARKKAEEDQSRTRAAAASSTSILKTGSTTPVDTQGSAPTPTLAAEPKAVPTPPQAYRRAPEPAPRPSKSQTPVIAAAAAAVLLLIAAGVWFMNRETTPAAEPEKTAAITPETTAPARPVTPEPAARVAPPQPQTTQPQTQQPATPAPAPQLQVLQSKLTFSWQRGTTAPPPQSFAISGSKQAFLATASSRWIAVSPNRATAPRNVTVSVNPGDLQPGTHSDIIRIVPTDNSFSTQTVAVEFVVTAEARQPEVAKQTPPAPTPIPQQTPQQTTQQTLPSQPAAQQAPAASSPSPAAQGKWLGATRGSITYSGDIPAGGRIVISTSKVIDGPSGDVDFSRTPPPFDAVRIEKTSAGVTAVPRGYDLVITNTSGAPIRLVQIEWSYQPKR